MVFVNEWKFHIFLAALSSLLKWKLAATMVGNLILPLPLLSSSTRQLPEQLIRGVERTEQHFRDLRLTQVTR